MQSRTDLNEYAFQNQTFRKLREVILVEPLAFRDERGWFCETYKKIDFEAEGISFDFVQDNHSRPTAGAF
jgi:dTDP-4-dehydrorhamnose 3,5-epimerase-like enzyme